MHPFPMMTMLDDSLLDTIGLLQKFVDGSLPIFFQPLKREERSRWIRSTLVRFRYLTLHRSEKHIVQQYVAKISGLSRAQVCRHIAAYKKNTPICAPYKRHRFPVTYTQRDIELLAATDNLHGRINGAATIAIIQAERVGGDLRYERLQDISVSRLYDLRKERRYAECALTIEQTKPVQRAIGERRKPEPQGAPGFLRVDSVHQGDCGKEKGLYHIHLVDEALQWEAIVAVEGISEEFLKPALLEILLSYPFVIQNFHSDNGSEFINHTVAGLLRRLLIKQTKSRPRHSNDNGLVETKNGAIIRKHMGYWHIPGRYAVRVNAFYREHFLPYLNFHRPCAFPVTNVLPNGKKIVKYPRKEYKTPFQKFLSLENPSQYLRPGFTLEMLREEAARKTPNQAAREMQEAKRKLFHIVLPRHSATL